jgi:hypothetical protein
MVSLGAGMCVHLLCGLKREGMVIFPDAHIMVEIEDTRTPYAARYTCIEGERGFYNYIIYTQVQVHLEAN